MKKLLALVVGAAILTAGALSQQPSSTVAATTCASGWTYLEEQDWWKPIPELPPGTEGHIHQGMCFPWGQAISGVVTFDVNYVFHNNHGTLIRRKFQDDASKSYGHVYTENYTPPSAVDSTTTRSFTIDTRLMKDGVRLFRFYAFFKHANGNEQIARLQWRANVQNGTADTNYTGALVMQGSGWYKEATCDGCTPIADWGYTNADVLDWVSAPKTGTFTTRVKHALNNTAPGPDVISSTAGYLDPNLHASPPSTGTVLGSCQIGGAVTGCKGTKTYSVPGGLSSGTHALVYVTCTVVTDRQHCGAQRVEFTVP